MHLHNFFFLRSILILRYQSSVIIPCSAIYVTCNFTYLIIWITLDDLHKSQIYLLYNITSWTVQLLNLSQLQHPSQHFVFKHCSLKGLHALQMQVTKLLETTPKEIIIHVIHLIICCSGKMNKIWVSKRSSLINEAELLSMIRQWLWSRHITPVPQLVWN